MAINGGLKINLISEFVDKGLKAAEKGFQSLGSKALEWGKNIAKAGAVAVAAMAAYAVKIGVDGVKAAIKAEAAQNRLAQILSTTGGATRKQIAALDDQAKALEKVGVVSAENVKVVQSQLATFDLNYKTLKNLTPAILDYVTAEKGATATTEDFKSMTNGLAQALQGNFASLTRTGFVLDETTKNMIANGTETERTAALVSVLNSTYKGFNETLTETTEGKLQQLKNQFGSLSEEIGVALLPVLNKLITAFSTYVIPVLRKASEWIVNNVVPALEKLADWLAPKIAPALERFGKWWTETAVPALKSFWYFMQKNIFPVLADLYNYLEKKLPKVFKQLEKFYQENKEELDNLAKFMAGAFVWAVKQVAAAIKMLGDGLLDTAKGLRSVTKQLKEAWQPMQRIIDGYNALNDFIFGSNRPKGIGESIFNDIQEEAKKLNLKPQGETAVKSWLEGWGVGWNSATGESKPKIDNFFGDFKSSVSSGTSAAIDAGTSKLKERMDKFKETLKSKLEEAKDAFKNFRDEVQSVIVDAIDFGAAWQKVEDAKKEAAENGTEFGGSFLDALIEQANKATEFAQKIQTLVKMGLSKDAISEVLAAGVDAGTEIANELIAGGSEAINKTNELVDSTKKAAKKVGKFAAEEYYGTGVETAKKMVQGFKDLVKEGGKGFKELMDAMDKLAKKLARTVKIKIEASSGGTTVEVPALAKGGIVRKPTLALIGEAGPEAVVPLKPRGRDMGIDPVGRTINIHVTGALDPEAVARQIETILKRSTLRAGAYS